MANGNILTVDDIIRYYRTHHGYILLESQQMLLEDAVVDAVRDISLPGGHIVKVRDDEVLVPFVKAIVPEVDVAGGRVIVTPPAGLFEDLSDDTDESSDEGSDESADAPTSDTADTRD